MSDGLNMSMDTVLTTVFGAIQAIIMYWVSKIEGTLSSHRNTINEVSNRISRIEGSEIVNNQRLSRIEDKLDRIAEAVGVVQHLNHDK